MSSMCPAACQTCTTQDDYNISLENRGAGLGVLQLLEDDDYKNVDRSLLIQQLADAKLYFDQVQNHPLLPPEVRALRYKRNPSVL